MMQLFKEITSPKNADNAAVDELKAGTAKKDSETPVAAPESVPKKGKHGDPGVCCGGCS
ncbi:CCGSCS motif protein [Marinobacter sp.]|uniref:CCGSCS motif protein n=1 Tax=Marinobacter sp. TaxID=50741 RepID=UPI001B58F0F3|nr:CCGSCS motif protein [Marinobacter sp.]MBQ0834199.1 CCGSCS motif protein [Marinobacter sp.]